MEFHRICTSNDEAAIRSIIMRYAGFRSLSYTEFLNKDGSVVSGRTLCTRYSTNMTVKEKHEIELVEKTLRGQTNGAVADTAGVIVALSAGLTVGGVVAAWLAAFWAPLGIFAVVGKVLTLPFVLTSGVTSTIVVENSTRKLISYFVKHKIGTTQSVQALASAKKQENSLLKECHFKSNSAFKKVCDHLHSTAVNSKTMNEFRAAIISTANKGWIWKTKRLRAWHFFTADGEERTPREICKAICNL